MKTKTPAITNQYGEMKTGMPNGRAMMIPGPDSRRWGGFPAVWGGFSGVVLATLPMLRAAPDARDARECQCFALRLRCGRRRSGGASRGDDPPRPARTPPGTGFVPVEGGGLHDVPAPVPVPHDRPAARAADHGDGARDAGARRAGAAVRPAGRGPDPGGGPRAAGRGMGPAGGRGARPG